MSGREAHRSATVVLSALMVLIGVALLVQAVAASASVVSPRTLLGVLFILAGAGRLYIEFRRGKRR